MKNQSHRRLSRFFIAIASVAALGTPAFATNATWNQVAGTASWNSGANWTGGVYPNAVGDTANFTGALTGLDLVNLNVALTVGTLNLGSSSANSFDLNTGTAGVLTLNNGGAGASINQNSGSNGDQVNAPIVIADSLSNTITNASTTKLFTIGGGITGTGNLTLKANAGGAITLNGASINNTGSITNSGSGAGLVTIGAGVGSNVTAITENSTTSALTISGTAISVNSGGTTVTNSNASGTSLVTISGGVTGTGNLVLNNNSAIASGITVSGTSVNNTGTITNSGTGSTTLISAGIGSNVSAITENSTASALSITGSTTVNAAGTTFTNSNASGSALLTEGAITGTGNIVLNNNSGIASGITLNANINNTGTVSNTGTGTGSVSITSGFGNNVTGVTQNSTTSTLIVATNTSTDATPYTVTNGTLQSAGGNWGANSSVTLANTAGATFSIVSNTTLGLLSGGGANGGNVTHTNSITFAATSGSATFNGTISGAGDIVTASTFAGTQTLAGNISYSGNSALTIGGSGTLIIGTGVTVGNGVSANDAYSLSTSNSANFTENSGAVINKIANGITQGSTGTMTINGTIGNAQGITVSSGTLAIGATGNISSAQGITQSGTGTITEAAGGNISALDGSAGITVNAGTATINSASNSYVGGTTIGMGTIVFGANANANFTTTGTTTVSSTSITGVGSTTGLFVGESITGANIKSGTTIASYTTNSITLSQATNTTGAASGATLTIGQFGAFGDSQLAGSITLGSTTLTGSASLLSSGAFTETRTINEAYTAGPPIVVPTNSSLVIGTQATGTGASATVYTGNIGLTAATTLSAITGGEADFTTGVISNRATFTTVPSLIIGGGGLVKLTGVNTFGGSGGSVTIQSGSTLNTTNATSNLGNSSNIVIFNNGIFQYGTGAGFDLSSRTLQFNSGGGTIDTNGNAITFLNSIGNSGAGTGGLTLADSNATPGSLTLSGSNTYTGGTTVTSGTLIVNNAAALGSTSGGLTVNTGGALNLNGNNQTVGNLTGTGGSIYNNGSSANTLAIGTGNATGGSYSGVIVNNTNSGTGTIAVTKNGTGTTTLNGANTYTGATAINSGTLTIGANGSLGGTAVTLGGGALQVGALNSNAATTIGTAGQGSLTINSGGTLIFANGVSGAVSTMADKLNIGNTSTGAVALTLGGSGAIDIGVGGSTGSDEISLGSGLLASVSGSTTVNLNVISALNGTSQELIAWGAMPTGGGSFTLGTINGLGGGSYTLSLSETSAGLFLNESSVSSAYWKGAQGTSWATGLPNGSSNFTTNLAGTTNRTAALDSFTSVIFTATGATNYANTTLDGPTTINNLTYNIGGVGIAAGGNGGSLTITASGSGITVNTGVGAATETISANVAIGATQTWTVNDALSNLLVSGTISGSGNGITKAGKGTLELTGSNSYSGATSVLGGALNVQSVNALNGTSGITVNSGAVLQLAGSGFTTPSTNLTINGTGVVTAVSTGVANGGALENVSGSNTYAGTISLGANASIGSDSGLLTLNASSLNTNGFTLTLTGAGNGEISSVISSGALTMSGTGTWTLDGTNTYAGTTTVNSGTLQLGGSGNGTLGNYLAPNPLTVTGGTVDMNGNTLIVGNLTGTGGKITNNASGTESILYVNATSNGTYGGNITDGAGTVDLYYNYNGGPFVAGTGITTLTGTNTFTGSGSAIFAGGLRLASNGALGTAASSPLFLTVISGAALQLSNNISSTSAAPLYLAGTGLSGGGALENYSGTNTWTSAINLNADTAIGSDSGSTLKLSSNATITGTSNLFLVGSGNGVLSGTINLGTGSLTVSSSGTWTPTSTNTTGTWTLNTPESYNGTYVTNGTLAYTSGSVLTGTGGITLGSTTASTTAALSYSGTGETISNALTFTGSQTVLLGNVGTGAVVYSATPTFSGGPETLVLGNATDTYGGSIGSIVNGTGGATTLVKTGVSNSTWILTGSNTYTGGTTINGGVLQVASAAAFPTTGTLTLNGTAGNAILQTNGTLNLTIGTNFNWGNNNGGFAAYGGVLNLNINSGGQLYWGVAASGTNNVIGTQGGSLLAFGSTTSNNQVIFSNNLSLGTSDPYSRSVYVEKGAGGDSTLFSGIISNGTTTAAASGLNKVGGGTLILSNANNSYSGYTTVVGGTLVAEGNSLVTVAGTSSSVTGVFGSGDGAAATPAPATFAPIYLGNTLGGGGSTLGGVINPTVMIGGNYTVSNPINVDWNNGTGQIYGVGGYLDAASTFSGPITLTGTAATGNTFAVTQVATTGADALNLTGGITATNGGNINFANIGAVNVSTTGITNGGASAVSVSQSGPGVTTLAATNTYTGATTISGGTLNVTGSISSSAVTVQSGGTLTGTGSTGAVTVNGGGILGLKNGSVGTLTVAGLSTGNAGAPSSFTFDIGSSAGSIDTIADSGTLTLNGVGGTTITIGNATGVSTLTNGLYNLITYTGAYTGSLSDLTLSTTSLDGVALSLVQGNGVIELQVGAPSLTAGYFNGLGNDLNTAGDYDTSASSSTASTSAPSAGSNLYFSATRNTSTTPNISAPLEVNSVNFGSGSGTNSSITVSSNNTADTLQIDATSANGNTSGSGITVTGGGTDTISAPVVLGGSQSWTTDSGSHLTVSGQVSGAYALTKAGLGVVNLTNPTGNIYTGGTTINAGKIVITNTSGSATGTGAVTVNSGGTLAGNGIINGAGVTVNGGGSLISGARSQLNGTGGLTSLGGMALAGTTQLTIGSSVGTANLTFDLASGNTGINGGNAGFHTFANPNNNTTYLSLNGSSSINFAGATSISLVDVTNTNGSNGSLSLLTGTPYLLIHAASNTDYFNLVINSGTNANPILSLSQNDGSVNGYVMGVWAGGTNPLTDYTAISIAQYGADGVTPLAAGPGGIYPAPALYLDAGNLEVVPEPGTWALMIGGLALLVVIQRRRNNLD